MHTESSKIRYKSCFTNFFSGVTHLLQMLHSTYTKNTQKMGLLRMQGAQHWTAPQRGCPHDRWAPVAVQSQLWATVVPQHIGRAVGWLQISFSKCSESFELFWADLSVFQILWIVDEIVLELHLISEDATSIQFLGVREFHLISEISSMLRVREVGTGIFQ